jgi:small subunit ribosomal protein S20
LANTKSALKCLRSAARRCQSNRLYRSTARTYVKKTRHLIEAGELEEAQVAARQAIKTLDKAAAKGIIHKNNAARRKARLLKRLNQAMASP